MSYPPFSLESAFRREIETITENDELDFTKKHFLFVNAYRCKSEPNTQQCIEQGRSLFGEFIHSTKIAKQRAFYCFSKCNASECYEDCKVDLRKSISNYTEKFDPVMNDYLLKFVPSHLSN